MCDEELEASLKNYKAAILRDKTINQHIQNLRKSHHQITSEMQHEINALKTKMVMQKMVEGDFNRKSFPPLPQEELKES